MKLPHFSVKVVSVLLLSLPLFVYAEVKSMATGDFQDVVGTNWIFFLETPDNPRTVHPNERQSVLVSIGTNYNSDSQSLPVGDDVGRSGNIFAFVDNYQFSIELDNVRYMFNLESSGRKVTGQYWNGSTWRPFYGELSSSWRIDPVTSQGWSVVVDDDSLGGRLELLGEILNTSDDGRNSGTFYLEWREVQRFTDRNGNTVIAGYLYASHNTVGWGSPANPEVYVKVWFDRSGALAVNFFHVGYFDIKVFSILNGQSPQGIDGGSSANLISISSNGARYQRHDYRWK